MALPLEENPNREHMLAEAYLAGFIGRIGMTPLESEAWVIYAEETLPGFNGSHQRDDDGDEFGRMLRTAVELGFALDDFTEPQGNFRRHEPRMVLH